MYIYIYIDSCPMADLGLGLDVLVVHRYMQEIVRIAQMLRHPLQLRLLVQIYAMGAEAHWKETENRKMHNVVKFIDINFIYYHSNIKVWSVSYQLYITLPRKLSILIESMSSKLNSPNCYRCTL